MGIEPTALAWEARVLPLYDARSALKVLNTERQCVKLCLDIQPLRCAKLAQLHQKKTPKSPSAIRRLPGAPHGASHPVVRRVGLTIGMRCCLQLGLQVVGQPEQFNLAQLLF